MSGNVTDMHNPTHLKGWKCNSHMQILMSYYLSHIVLKHSRERRVTVMRQLTDWHFQPLWPKIRRHCQMCFCAEALTSQWLGQAITTGLVQFLAAMTTDNATPPMATAVAPNSHFQLRPWGNERNKSSMLNSIMISGTVKSSKQHLT